MALSRLRQIADVEQFIEFLKSENLQSSNALKSLLMNIEILKMKQYNCVTIDAIEYNEDTLTST